MWDHLAFVWGMPSADPWVTLTACALRTETIRLGTGITPVPRRRVQDLALELTTLDRLSGGRVVFGAGLGGNRGEFERFGESFSRAPGRAARPAARDTALPGSTARRSTAFG